MEIKLTLTEEEAMAVLQLIGQLPTSSNAYPLFVKCSAQVKKQVEDQEKDQIQPEAEENFIEEAKVVDYTGPENTYQ